MFDQCIRFLDKAERAEDVSRYLDQIGTLIDIPRILNETNAQFLERLKPYFANIPSNDAV